MSPWRAAFTQHTPMRLVSMVHSDRLACMHAERDEWTIQWGGAAPQMMAQRRECHACFEQRILIEHEVDHA